MTASGLLRRTSHLTEQQTKYVSIYLNDDILKPEVKIGTLSCHAVLSEMHWFILVTIKYDTPKNEVHETVDSQHTLAVDSISASRVRTLVCI